MRNKVHKSDKDFFKGGGKEKGSAKSWSLVYRIGGTKQIILAEKDYPLCVWKKQQCKQLPQYKTGTLKIEPNY